MHIVIGRYEPQTDLPEGVNDPADRWEGWVEPDDKSWILFVAANGEPLFWPRRYPEGGVIGPPVSRAFLDALYERFGQDAIQEVIEAVRFGI